MLRNANTATFEFHKVVWWHYSGKVRTIFLYEILSLFRIPKIIEIGWFFSPSYSKFKGGGSFFWDTVYIKWSPYGRREEIFKSGLVGGLET